MNAQEQHRRKMAQYMANPKVRKRINAQRKARYHANKDAINASRRERYATDPEYRKNKLFVNNRAARSRSTRAKMEQAT